MLDSDTESSQSRTSVNTEHTLVNPPSSLGIIAPSEIGTSDPQLTSNMFINAPGALFLGDPNDELNWRPMLCLSLEPTDRDHPKLCSQMGLQKPDGTFLPEILMCTLPSDKVDSHFEEAGALSARFESKVNSMGSKWKQIVKEKLTQSSEPWETVVEKKLKDNYGEYVDTHNKAKDVGVVFLPKYQDWLGMCSAGSIAAGCMVWISSPDVDAVRSAGSTSA